MSLHSSAAPGRFWRSAAIGAIGLAALAAACGSDPQSETSPSGSASPSASGAQVAAAADPAHRRAPRTRQGSAVALTPDGANVLVADEDHEALYVVPASLEAKIDVVALPGPPAQIVAEDGLVLVTIRTLPTDASRAAREAIRGATPDPSAAKPLAPIDTTKRDAPQAPLPNRGVYDPSAAPASSASASSAPAAPKSAKPHAPSAKPATPPPSASAAAPSASATSKRGTPSKPLDPQVVRESQGGLLVALAPDASGKLVEVGRVVVAADAWGLAMTPDGARAVVTSAWTSEVAVVDVAKPEAMRVVMHEAVAREPRGVVITKDGKTAFVSHLVGAPLTKITSLDGEPKVAPLQFPTALARGPQGIDLHASLAYSLLLSPDESTLFVPRHALGANGIDGWWGATTIDTMDVATEKPLQPAHVRGSPGKALESEQVIPAPSWGAKVARAAASREELVQPRGSFYRASTDTILVASEGEDAVAEVDALAVDPAMAVRQVYWIGREYDKFGQYPESGGAPTGIVLSADDASAFVFCRTTFDLVKIDLATKVATRLHLADDALPLDAARGRRLFANASSRALSGGLGCAACHPEGRDDGYTWREGNLSLTASGENPRFVGLRENVNLAFNFAQGIDLHPDLHPRQTPMLAGRLRSAGPYGWHGENATIADRLFAGFQLHREAWGSIGGGFFEGVGERLGRIDAISDFAQSGLMPPPMVVHPMTDQEKRGKELFESKSTQCSTCHVAGGGMTDRKAHELAALPVRPGFDAEEKQAWKTPSLWFIAGSAPYFHDGSSASLESLVKQNGTRMGSASQLSADDQAALVAYLKTL